MNDFGIAEFGISEFGSISTTINLRPKVGDSLYEYINGYIKVGVYVYCINNVYIKVGNELRLL